MQNLVNKMGRGLLVTGLAILGCVWLVIMPVFSGAGSSDANRDRPVSFSKFGNFLASRYAGDFGDFDAASFYNEQAIRFNPGNRDLLLQALDVSVSAGDMGDALRYAKRLAKIDKDNNLSNLVLALDYIKKNKLSKALKLLKFIEGSPFQELTSNIIQAWVYTGMKKHKKAYGIVDNFIKKYPWSERFVLYPLALMKLQASIPIKEKLAAFSAAENYHEGDIELLLNYVFLLQESGEDAKVKEMMAKLVKAAPLNVYIMRAKHLFDNGEKITSNVSNIQQGIASFLFRIALALERETDRQSALQFVQMAYFMDEKNDQFLLKIANILQAFNQFSLAHETLDHISMQSAFYSKALLTRVYVYDSADNRAQAKKLLEQYIEKYPDDVQGYIVYGQILRKYKDYKAAERIYSQVLERKEKKELDNWQLYYARGISYERLKIWPKAEKDFKEALALSPNEPAVLNYLGYSWIDQGLNLGEALDMIKKAVSLRPRDGFIVDSLGWAYYQLGQYEKATSFLERAVELEPSDPIINDHLGDSYWKMNRKVEAKFQWQRARDLEPEPENLEKILEKIEKGMPPENHRKSAKAGQS